MLQISTNNEILIDGERTGFCVKQDAEKTVVYVHETGCEVTMPFKRYALSCQNISLTGNPGRKIFAEDIKNMM